MSRKIAGWGALAVLCAALPPAGASAQRISSPYEFVERGRDAGPFVAWMATDRGRVNLGPKSGPVYGAQGAFRLSDPLQIGAFLGYFDSERDVINPRAEGGATAIGVEDLDILLISGRLQLNLTGARTWHNLMPYVLLGAGVAIDVEPEPVCVIERDRPQCALNPIDRFNFDKSFLGQFGLGAAWIVSQRLGLRFTVHDNIWRFSAPEGFFDPDLQLDPAPEDAEWTNNIQLTTSVSFWF